MAALPEKPNQPYPFPFPKRKFNKKNVNDHAYPVVLKRGPGSTTTLPSLSKSG